MSSPSSNSPISNNLVTRYKPMISAFPSSSAEYCSFNAFLTVPCPLIVFLIPRPWATSWNIVFPKKASNVTCLRCSGSISTLDMGTRILSYLACIAFFSCNFLDPAFNCTSSSFGKLIAMVLLPALQSPA